MLYGLQAALIAESFTGGCATAAPRSAISSPPRSLAAWQPLIAAWLFGTYRSTTAIASYIAVCAVITLVATALMTDYTGKDISGEYESR